MSKSIHEMRSDKDHVMHPAHFTKGHMKNMAKEKMPQVDMSEGSPQEEASESPQVEAQEQASGME